MDPLSLTTGIVTLLGACTAASKTFAKIRRLKDAPALIQALKSETGELQLMLRDTNDRLESIESRRSAPSRVDEAVLRLCVLIINRTKDKILEVDSLIQYQLLKEDEDKGTRVYKRAFLQNYNKLIKFQAELQELRHRVGDVSKILGVQDISRIEGALNNVQSSLAVIFQRQNRTEQQVERLANSQSNASSSSSETSQEENLLISGNTPSGIDASTIPSITCTCVRQEVSTHLRTFLGIWFLGYTENKQSCLYHCQAELRVVFFFPLWFLRYVIWLQVQSGPILCTLSWIQVIPRDHVVLDMIKYGDIDGIKNLFISGQVSIRAQMPNGANLLYWAIWHANSSSTKFLVDAEVDKFYESPYHLSAQTAAWDQILSNDQSHEWRETLRSLFPKPDFDEYYHFSPLHHAVLGLTSRSIENILNKDAYQINSTDSYGRTALSWAAYRGDHKTIRALLHYQPDCNKGDKVGEIPLVYACRVNIQCMALLLQPTANIHWRHEMTRGTLLHATTAGLRDSGGICRVRTLVEADININAQNIYGETALHLAIHPQEKYTKLAGYLISHGADPTIYDKRGNNALSYAVRRNCHALVGLLLHKHQDHTKQLDDYGTFMHLVAEFADMKTLRLLTQDRLKRRDINVKNRAGLTPIQIALRRSNVDYEWRDTFFNFLWNIDENV